MLDRVEAKGIEKGVTKGEDMIIALLKPLLRSAKNCIKSMGLSRIE